MKLNIHVKNSKITLGQDDDTKFKHLSQHMLNSMNYCTTLKITAKMQEINQPECTVYRTRTGNITIHLQMYIY